MKISDWPTIRFVVSLVQFQPVLNISECMDVRIENTRLESIDPSVTLPKDDKSLHEELCTIFKKCMFSVYN